MFAPRRRRARLCAAPVPRGPLHQRRPGLLERGPIAVFESGAFLGQGVLEPLAAGGEATVPFALERSVAVDTDQRSHQQSARLARIERRR